jgi:Fur family ferric uptake transcriptional regulator
VSENHFEKLNQYIEDEGLRHSSSREQVAKAFFSSEDHITVEDLYEKVKKKNPKIGLATVYRTLNLLQDIGLAVRRDFDTGDAAYEPYSDDHHDHLICSSCAKIVEFYEDDIEKAQVKIAKKYGFILTDHKMELYGLCKACQKK